MKQFLLALILFGTITFALEHPGNVDGYRIFMRFDNNNAWHQIWEGTAKQCTVEIPDGFKLHFVAVAFKDEKTSEYSNQVSATHKLTTELED